MIEVEKRSLLLQDSRESSLLRKRTERNKDSKECVSSEKRRRVIGEFSANPCLISIHLVKDGDSPESQKFGAGDPITRSLPISELYTFKEESDIQRKRERKSADKSMKREIVHAKTMESNLVILHRDLKKLTNLLSDDEAKEDLKTFRAVSYPSISMLTFIGCHLRSLHTLRFHSFAREQDTTL